MKPKLTLSSLIRAIVVVVFCCSTTALAATDEVEVGVTAASVTNATGNPPISPVRDLETGLEVFFNEKIETSPSGRAQLLFRDGTSLTVGSSSEMTIDEYVFDPDTGTGELVINVSKGIFRLVGGKISKNTPVVFNTKTATVAVRGGIAMLNVNPMGVVQADFIFGQQMTLTSIVAATGESATRKTSRAGTFIEANPKGVSQVQKREPAALAAMTSALERPVKKPSPAAEESAGNTGNTETGTTQTQENVPESEPDPDAVVEVAATTTQLEDGTDPSSQDQAREPTPLQTEGAKNNVSDQIESGLSKLKDTSQSLSDSSPTTTLASTPTGRDEVAAVAKEAATDETTKLAEEAAAKKLAAKKLAAKKLADKKAADAKVADKKVADKKVAAKKLADKKAADAKVAAAAAAAAAAAEEEEEEEEEEDPVCAERDWYGDCIRWERQATINLIARGDKTELRAYAYVYGKPIGTLVSSGSSPSLCIDCRFLNWQRQPLYASGNVIGLHYWVQGAATSAAELAAAASKTATYSGGMIGSVVNDGALREHLGRFDSRVEFGFSHYRVNAFNAQFDNQRFTGSSGVTLNSQAFGVTASALASGRDSARDRVLQASGYFAGSPAATGSPPPEIGGSFNITGDRYSAQGVFLGKQ